MYNNYLLKKQLERDISRDKERDISRDISEQSYIDFVKSNTIHHFIEKTIEFPSKVKEIPFYFEWDNVGKIPPKKLKQLRFQLDDTNK